MRLISPKLFFIVAAIVVVVASSNVFFLLSPRTYPVQKALLPTFLPAEPVTVP